MLANSFLMLRLTLYFFVWLQIGLLVSLNAFHFLQELTFKDRYYHEHCFRCFRCDRSLSNASFTSHEDVLLCNDCYCNEFSSKCVSCNKIVMPGREFMNRLIVILNLCFLQVLAGMKGWWCEGVKAQRDGCFALLQRVYVFRLFWILWLVGCSSCLKIFGLLS